MALMLAISAANCVSICALNDAACSGARVQAVRKIARTNSRRIISILVLARAGGRQGAAGGGGKHDSAGMSRVVAGDDWNQSILPFVGAQVIGNGANVEAQ